MKRKQTAAVVKPRRMYNLITRLVTLAVVIGCVASIVIMQSNRAEMQKELNAIQSKTEEFEAENVELQRILDADDIDAYMEKLAIEKMNYAYPNERRFYDTSRN